MAPRSWERLRYGKMRRGAQKPRPGILKRTPLLPGPLQDALIRGCPLNGWPEAAPSVLGRGFLSLHGRGGVKQGIHRTGPHLQSVWAQLCTVSP